MYILTEYKDLVLANFKIFDIKISWDAVSTSVISNGSLVLSNTICVI